jgi:NADPH:quinone reductase-like Zn-dependent oxidoreductase
MRAIQFDRHGEPAEVLQLREVAPPSCGPGQARIRMLYSPINPSDLLRVRGTYGIIPSFPMSPGFEGVGIVEEVKHGSASAVLGVKPGRKVVVLNQDTGNWQDQVVIPALRAFPVPDGIADEQAAGFFVNPATALIMTTKVLKIPAEGLLMQSAAGSAVGKMVIKLGKRFNFRTLNIVRREETGRTLQKLGADYVFDSSQNDIVEGVQKITNFEPVPYAIDPVGGETTGRMIQALGPGGRMLLYGSLDRSPAPVSSRHVIQNGLTIEGFALQQWSARRRPIQMLFLLRQIGKLMKEGVLTTDIAQVFPLEQYREGVEAAESSGRQGKVLLKMG